MDHPSFNNYIVRPLQPFRATLTRFAITQGALRDVLSLRYALGCPIRPFGAKDERTPTGFRNREQFQKESNTVNPTYLTLDFDADLICASVGVPLRK
jgi:hypothetical protein